jgi:hypothetical protein
VVKISIQQIEYVINGRSSVHQNQRVMIYNSVSGFLAVVRVDSSAPFPSPTPVSNLSLFLIIPLCRQSSLQTAEGRDGGRSKKNHTTARRPGPP